jgi:hypothetical protein
MKLANVVQAFLALAALGCENPSPGEVGRIEMRAGWPCNVPDGCDFYEIAFAADNSAEFHGRGGMSWMQGDFSGEMRPEEGDLLRGFIRAIGYRTLEHIPPSTADYLRVTIKIEIDGEEIVQITDNIDVQPELWGLERAIEGATLKVSWTPR